MDTTNSDHWQLRRIGCPATCPLVLDVFPLKEGTVTFGRNQKNDYFLDSRRLKNFISRTHAEITGYYGASGLEFKIREQGLNGTFINDIRIQGSRILSEGDKVTFGHTNGYKIKPGEYSVQHNSEFEFVFERVPPKLCVQHKLPSIHDYNDRSECLHQSCDCTNKDCHHGKTEFSDPLKFSKPHLSQESTFSYTSTSPLPEFLKPSPRSELSKHISVSEISKASAESEITKNSGSESTKHYDGLEFSKFTSGLEFSKQCTGQEFSKQNPKPEFTKNSPISKYQNENKHNVEETFEEQGSSDSEAECIMEVCLEDSSEHDVELETLQNSEREGIRNESGGNTSFDSVDGLHPYNKTELRNTAETLGSINCDINDNVTVKDDSLQTCKETEMLTSTFQRQSTFHSVHESLSDESLKTAMLQDIQNFDHVSGRSKSVPVNKTSEPILSHNSSTIEKDAKDSLVKKNQSNARSQSNNKRKKGQTKTRRKRKRNQLSDSETDELEDGVEWYDTDTCASANCTRPKAKRVAWVQCDDCDQWYHTVCADCNYEMVKDSKMQFHCGC